MSNILKIAAAGVEAAAPTGYQIERSLRFNSADSAYLSRTPASAGNRKTWTWSGWVKRSGLGGALPQVVFQSGNPTTPYTVIQFQTDNSIQVTFSGGVSAGCITSAVFRDVSAWYHILVSIDTTQATSTNRLKLYINNVEQSFGTANYPSQNYDSPVNNTVLHTIGSYGSPSGYDFSGYLTEIHFVDGQALTPSDFGETDATTGVWVPKAYAGTYGTNGFYLPFSDNTSTTTLGYDEAGSNDWTLNNFSVAAGAGNDSLVDTPTPYGTDTGAGGEVRGNYCTWNPLDTALTGINNGNLNSGNAGGASWKHCRSTLQLTSGKWYWECLVSGAPDANNGYQTGLLTPTASLTADPNSASTGFYTRQNIIKYTNGTLTNPYFTTTTANDIIMFAFDADAGKLWCGKNGTWEVSGDPAAGTNENWSSVPTNVFPMAGSYGSSINTTLNTGQRPFAYTAPSGFKALCTQNLPDPTIADGRDYFNTLLWTGDGTGARTFSGLEFAPDFVWTKARNQSYGHLLFDSVRGGNKRLSSQTTNAEVTNPANGYISTFNSDGFSTIPGTTNNGDFNELNTTQVAWNWNAGGSNATNTDGTITSTVRANPTAGFSVVTYTGNGSTSPYPTVGHGLGVAPKMYIVKDRSATGQWVVQHSLVDGSSDYLYLDSTAANDNSVLSLPTSTVMSVGGSAENTNGNNYIAYCFAEVEGYSKFGSYTGNGSADGPFVYANHRPAFIMVKRTDSTSNWTIIDTKREGYNVDNDPLYPNLSNAEGTTDLADILSNGFKLRSTDASVNASGGTYIFMSLASNPFKYSLAR